MRTGHVRRLVAAVTVLGVAAAGQLVGPAPAALAAPGLVRISAASAGDSSPSKTATAQCPAGTMVVGGGGYVPNAPVNPQGEVFITGLRPFVSPFGTGFQTLAGEDDTGFAGAWSVVSVALCAPTPPGLAYRWHTSATSSAASRTAAVACPAGTKLLGTGGVVNGGGQHVVLESSFPSTDIHAVAQAHEDESGYAGSWSVTAWGICADPPAGWERVVQVGPFAPGSALAECPGSKRVHGAGAVLSGGAGQARLAGAYPVFPVELESVLVAANEDETGYPQRWSLAAIAICAY
jgi:hypothetical protein